MTTYNNGQARPGQVGSESSDVNKRLMVSTRKARHLMQKHTPELPITVHNMEIGDDQLML